MKALPTNRQEWLNLLAIPFKTFVFSYCFIYYLWLNSLPGTPGTIGGPDYSELERWDLGYCLTFVILVGIAVAQALTKNRRGAAWNIVFAILSLFFGAGGNFHPYYR